MTQFTLRKTQTVDLWQDMLWLRREFRQDSEFFKVPDLWGEMCEDNPNYRTKTVAVGDPTRAGVLAFGDKATLIVTKSMWDRALKGCWLANFTLAHEITHLACDHHAMGAVVKNFKLFDGPDGKSNKPPTIEEYEANVGAAFLQCGVALMDKDLPTLTLARRAFCDPTYVRKAQQFAQLESFQEEIAMRIGRYPRIVF